MTPRGYSRQQILLHWSLAILILSQMILHDGIVAVMDGRLSGAPIEPSLTAKLHIFAGFLIFILAGIRLFVRLDRGVPKAPASEPAPLKLIAHLTHIALYAFMLVMPISGALTWFQDAALANQAHSTAKYLLAIVILLHISGALYQHFIAKTEVLTRMLRANDETL